MQGITNTGPAQKQSPTAQGALPQASVAGPVHSLFAAALLDIDIEPPEGTGKAGAGAPKRFAVYRNNVVVSLTEALQAAYPSVAAILDENFARVARPFINAHPPETPVMSEFGRQFADFIAGFPPLQNAPFLADLARAERLWLDAFHAEDRETLAPDTLTSIPPEALAATVLLPHPAAAIHQSRYPVFDLFGARNEWPPETIDLEKPQAMLITRPELDVLVFNLQQDEAEFFASLFKGTSLETAINEISDTHPGFDAAGAIAILMQSGAFSGVVVKGS